MSPVERHIPIQDGNVPPVQLREVVMWGLGCLFSLCMALGMWELKSVSDQLDRVEQRQLTAMLPGLARVEERLANLDRFCCSEIRGPIPKADVIYDDDPTKGKPRGR